MLYELIVVNSSHVVFPLGNFNSFLEQFDFSNID
jgi:hypothetical protein